jgi:peptidyl-prolyl cis-trans isomerase B (cyclophilin B)
MTTTPTTTPTLAKMMTALACGVCSFALSMIVLQAGSSTNTAFAQPMAKPPAKLSSNPPAKLPYHPKYVIAVTQGKRSLGNITIELLPEVAPKHAANFDSLARTGFFNGTAFHRVMPGFMVQGGDPNSKSKPKSTWGMGDPSQRLIPAEFSPTSHTRGIISAARMGNDINSATSQFFICHGDATPLDGKYSVFGRVVSGLDVLDSIASVQCEPSMSGEKSSPVEKVEMTVMPKLQYTIAVKHDGKPLGSILLETLPEVAPKHVANFDSLVAARFYDSTVFHRVVSGFMIQGGDPATKPSSGKSKAEWGSGMPGQTTVPAEFNATRHTRGIISAARTNERNSATSQFFICHGDPSSLDGQYSVWGQVLAGMEVVDAIVELPLEADASGAVSAPVKRVEMIIRRR